MNQTHHLAIRKATAAHIESMPSSMSVDIRDEAIAGFVKIIWAEFGGNGSSMASVCIVS